MKVNVIVQARMGSTRLPGKVMREMNGKPMIGHLIDRMEEVEAADKVVYGIPREDLKGPLDVYLRERGCCVAWGQLSPREDINDVAGLFEAVLNLEPCDAFVRVCADSPMLLPLSVDRVITPLRVGAPYVSAVGASGQQCQGVRTDVFLEYLPKFTDEEREHVLLYFDRASSTVVDTEDDFRRVERMMKLMMGPYSFEDVLAWRRPQ